MDSIPEPAKGSAWFVTNGCYLLRFFPFTFRLSIAKIQSASNCICY